MRRRKKRARNPVGKHKEVVMPDTIETMEEAFDHFVKKAADDLSELKQLGISIHEDTTYEAVDKDDRISEWEKSLIKLLIFLRPVFDLIISSFPAVRTIFEWAMRAYDLFAEQGKIEQHMVGV
jgi:hypothetical protein